MIITTNNAPVPPTIHFLKIRPKHFIDVQSGAKKADMRWNDRDFQVGDILRLTEFTDHHTYSGKFEDVRITHILSGEEFNTAIRDGYVMLSFERIDDVRATARQVAALTERIAVLERERVHANDVAASAMAEITPANKRIAEAENRIDTDSRIIASLESHIAALEAKLHNPELRDFATGVVYEAAHQRERWGASHDAGKEPQDWFWLLGWLAGKALKAHASGDKEKALHHCISSAAVLANWHAAVNGTYTALRPGIDPVARGIEEVPSAAAPTNGGPFMKSPSGRK